MRKETDEPEEEEEESSFVWARFERVLVVPFKVRMTRLMVVEPVLSASLIGRLEIENGLVVNVGSLWRVGERDM